MTKDPDLHNIYGQLDHIERLLIKLSDAKTSGKGQSGFEAGQIDATISNLPIGVVTIEKDGKIENVNPAFLKIFGVKSDTVLQNEYIIDLQPIKSGGIEHYFTELCEKNIDFDFESPEILNYSDERIYLHCRGFVLPGSDSLYMLLFSNITRRKRL